MHVDDAVWLKVFGHSDSQVEPVPKLGKQKLNRAQMAAGMILDAKRLREAPRRAKTLFDDQDTTLNLAEQPQRAQDTDAVVT